MPTVVPEIIRVTTTMIPALKNIQLIRGLIVPLNSAGEMNEFKALEQLQRDIDKQKQERIRRRNTYNKRVIKLKDAMDCVETSFNSSLLLRFGKGLLNAITGSPEGAMDLMYKDIEACMLRKALQQRNARSKGRYVKIRGPGIGTLERYNLPEGSFSELVKVRRGKLHPHIPH